MPLDALKNYYVSAVRTIIPMLIGAIVSWLSTKNIHLSEHMLTLMSTILDAISAIVYYLLVRILEHFDSRFGWLLGYAKMPAYSTPALPEETPLPSTDEQE